MVIVYPSILLPPPDQKNWPDIKTLVGIKNQLEHWPAAVWEPDACNDLPTTIQAILALATDTNRIVPLVEKVVLACGLVSNQLGLKQSLSLAGALNGTDRLRQRRALEPTRLNPRWYVNEIGSLKFPLIAKKAASARSSGVKLISHEKDLEDFLEIREPNVQEQRLKASGHPPDYKFLAEEFIEGENWEVSGVNREKTVHIFPPLKQIWTAPAGKITEYHLVPPPAGLIDAAMQATESCGLQWCAWCVELKGRENYWKVVEVNCRLGEDGKNYYKLLGSTTLANKICQLLS